MDSVISRPKPRRTWCNIIVITGDTVDHVVVGPNPRRIALIWGVTDNGTYIISNTAEPAAGVAGLIVAPQWAPSSWLRSELGDVLCGEWHARLTAAAGHINVIEVIDLDEP